MSLHNEQSDAHGRGESQAVRSQKPDEQSEAMRPSWWSERRAWMVFAVFFVCAAYLSLKGLGNAAYWDEEASNAIVARTLLKTGKITGWDGRNLMAGPNGGALRNDLRPLHSPLDAVLAAMGFAVCGVSTWGGRLPYVLAGLLAIAVYALALRNDFGTRNPWMWIYGLGLMCFSTGLLLYIRNCRYFALTVLFPLLVFYFYRRYMKSRRGGDLLWAAAFSVLFFVCNYVMCLSFLAALAITRLAFYPRAFNAKELKDAATSAAVFLAVVVPYAVYDRIWDRPDLVMPAGEPPAPVRHLTLLWWNLRDYNLIACLPYPILAAAIAIFVLLRKKDPAVRVMAEWGTAGLAYLVVVAFLSPQPVTIATFSFSDPRHLIVCVPFFAAVTASVLAFFARWDRIATTAIFGVLLCCNAVSLSPFDNNKKFRWLLPAYLNEIHHKYPTGCQAAVDYLAQKVRQDDLVFATPDFMNSPLMFYLGDRARFCCLINKQTHLPLAAIEALHAPLFIEDSFPDWFVVFGPDQETDLALSWFSRPRTEKGNPAQFQYERVAVLKAYFDQIQRPELPWHSFGPKVVFDPNAAGVYVFHKRMGAAP